MCIWYFKVIGCVITCLYNGGRHFKIKSYSQLLVSLLLKFLHVVGKQCGNWVHRSYYIDTFACNFYVSVIRAGYDRIINKGQFTKVSTNTYYFRVILLFYFKVQNE